MVDMVGILKCSPLTAIQSVRPCNQALAHGQGDQIKTCCCIRKYLR